MHFIEVFSIKKKCFSLACTSYFIKIIHLRLGLGLEANDKIEDGGRDSQCVRLGESERREDGTKRGGHREQDGARAEYCGGEQKALVEYVE